MNKSTRGGYRKNAKRPPLYGSPMRRITIFLPADYLIHLSKVNANISRAIREIIESSMTTNASKGSKNAK
jgi:hypothetical protein